MKGGGAQLVCKFPRGAPPTSTAYVVMINRDEDARMLMSLGLKALRPIASLYKHY